MKRLSLLFLLLISNKFSFGQSGTYRIRFVETKNGITYVHNQNNTPVILIDTIRLNMDSVFLKIEQSDLSPLDQQLIIRITKMQGSYENQMSELLKMSRTYVILNRLLLNEFFDQVEKRFGDDYLQDLLFLK